MAHKNKMSKWTTVTPEELKQQFEKATQLGEEARKAEPRAKSAVYDGQHRRLVIEMMDRSLLAIPVDQIQGLAGASPADIKKVEISGSGDTLQWEKLDLYFSVSGLAAQRFGTRAWMAELGRKGGRATTTVKAAASRVNGQKGGRPRKSNVLPQPHYIVLKSDVLSVNAILLHPDIDHIDLIVSNQSQQPTKALIKYKQGLMRLERTIPTLVGNLMGQFVGWSKAVIPARVEGAEEARDYAALAPTA